ncbi:MAG TPA: hypothetical protein VEL28_04800 [Candidatus Binatia bacterium]|nr:hypothetical protein [Candidatus Binatia bacterium]
MPRCERKPFAVATILTSLTLLAAMPGMLQAQPMLQLDPIPPKYTLGRFEYEPPRADGWRQIANSTQSLQLVYVEQMPGSDEINTKFGVVMEAHDIPAGTQIPTPHYLAELSRTQQAEQRKSDITGVSPILLVPGTTNIYTYRFLAKTPEGASEPEAYEVFYVTMAPDESQYLVIQCITKEKTYENQVYFTQFYATLPSIKHLGKTAADAAPAGEAKPAAPVAVPGAPAPATPPAPPSPATPGAPAAPVDPHAGHGH